LKVHLLALLLDSPYGGEKILITHIYTTKQQQQKQQGGADGGSGNGEGRGVGGGGSWDDSGG